MVNRTIRCESIVAYLQQQMPINAVVSGGIFYGLPITVPTKTYVTVNPIAQNDFVVEKNALVEVRIIGKDTKKVLTDILDVITDSLLTSINYQFDIGGFEVYKIVEGGSFKVHTDEDGRNIIIKDFIFYFVK